MITFYFILLYLFCFYCFKLFVQAAYFVGLCPRFGFSVVLVHIYKWGWYINRLSLKGVNKWLWCLVFFIFYISYKVSVPPVTAWVLLRKSVEISGIGHNPQYYFFKSLKSLPFQGRFLIPSSNSGFIPGNTFSCPSPQKKKKK